MTKKLTLNQATSVMIRACKSDDGLRMGQRIYNIVSQDYPEVVEGVAGTDKDFFYEEDSFKATSIFFNNFVEE